MILFALLGCSLLLATARPLAAQGVKPKSSAVVFYGSCANTSKPSVIDYKKVRKATPEYKTMRAKGVRRGSARYNLLQSRMDKRIKRACAGAAKAGGYDCVLRSGDIKDARGLKVTNLTDKVITRLESDDGSS